MKIQSESQRENTFEWTSVVRPKTNEKRPNRNPRQANIQSPNNPRNEPSIETKETRRAMCHGPSVRVKREQKRLMVNCRGQVEFFWKVKVIWVFFKFGKRWRDRPKKGVAKLGLVESQMNPNATWSCTSVYGLFRPRCLIFQVQCTLQHRRGGGRRFTRDLGNRCLLE